MYMRAAWPATGKQFIKIGGDVTRADERDVEITARTDRGADARISALVERRNATRLYVLLFNTR